MRDHAPHLALTGVNREVSLDMLDVEVSDALGAFGRAGPGERSALRGLAFRRISALGTGTGDQHPGREGKPSSADLNRPGHRVSCSSMEGRMADFTRDADSGSTCPRGDARPRELSIAARSAVA